MDGGSFHRRLGRRWFATELITFSFVPFPATPNKKGIAELETAAWKRNVAPTSYSSSTRIRSNPKDRLLPVPCRGARQPPSSPTSTCCLFDRAFNSRKERTPFLNRVSLNTKGP